MTAVHKQLIPVTVVSGFKGAGKTSLIDHLRVSAKGKRFGVLSDDGERNLVAELEALATGGALDHALVECDAIEEPFYVAEHLVYGDERSAPPESYKIDAMITVIDASTFIRDILENDDLADRNLAIDPGDDRLVPEVLVEQVEFADVLVVNKTDLVTAEHLSKVEALLTRLNPRARLVLCSHGRAPMHEVLDTHYFEFDATEHGAGWLAELDGEFDGLGVVCGVSSFTFTEHLPFHPLRFNELLSELETEGLVRAKGQIWIATRHHEIGVWALAGLASVLAYGGAWFAATPARDWPQDEAERAAIMEEWVPPFGDRRQEIAFIGVEMDESSIRERLAECLLTSDEMKDGPESWRTLPDPLPDWHTDVDAEPFGSGDQHWS